MTDSITVKVKRMANNSLALPTYATAASAGVDLSADLREPITVSPGENVKIPTGLAIELPSQSVVALVFARSGLASRHGIGLTNGVGVIDSDYRGEIQVLIQNLGTQPVTIKPGDSTLTLKTLLNFRKHPEGRVGLARREYNDILRYRKTYLRGSFNFIF